MKKTIFAFISLVIFIIFLISISDKKIKEEKKYDFTDNCFGIVTLKDKVIPSLKACGLVRLNRVKVTGIAKIDGNLIANDLTAKEIFINGDAKIDASYIPLQLNINGLLKSSNSNFNNIVANSNKIILKKCEVVSIIFKEPFENTDQILELIDSRIKEDIEFKSGKGKVILTGESKVKGKIIGGKIIS